MSFFNYLFDSDWMQRADLERLDERAQQLEARVMSSRERSSSLEADVTRLRRDVSGLILTVETMLRVMADKGICNREDFVARMRALDAEDGVEDGQISTPKAGARELRYCDTCQHFNAPNLKACAYCGRLFGPKKT
jgi:hypothetical protein